MKNSFILTNFIYIYFIYIKYIKYINIIYFKKKLSYIKNIVLNYNFKLIFKINNL
jgi:hypothetical protein